MALGARWPGGVTTRGLSADVDSEVQGNALQASGVTLTDRPEFPFTTVAVKLTKNHGRLGRGVLGQIVSGDLGATGLIDDADERVAHLTEVLPARLGLVDADRSERGSMDRSEGDLGADADGTFDGQPEVLRRVRGVVRDGEEQPGLPGRHAGVRGADDGDVGEEVGQLLQVGLGQEAVGHGLA